MKKYIAFSILDYLFTFGGTSATILYNYLVDSSTMGYKLSFTGIILFVAVVLFAKASFEKHYRDKLDTMLQQLAEATDESVKSGISEAIKSHKVKNNIYSRVMLLLPFVILVFVTSIGAKWIENLRASAGLILASMSAGSFFNVLKKQEKEKLVAAKYTGE